MKIVNIPRSIPDPKYRYQMPLLTTKIEGKGINIHTNLTNVKKVATALRVPPGYILKFMGYELGSQVNFKENNFSINGERNEDDVLKSLDKFIEKYVLCSQCHLPETVLTLAQDKRVVAVCKSCGKSTDMDPKHKLTSYVLKHPPQDLSEIKHVQHADSTFKQIQNYQIDLRSQRLEIRRMIAGSSFTPNKEEDALIFSKIKDYLNLILPLSDTYDFDDGHTELVYKGIKRLRLSKIHYDRVGYLLFNYIFDENIIKQIEKRATLFEAVLKRHKMERFVGHELILNVQDFFFRPGVNPEKIKAVPTVLMKFYEEKLLSEVN